MSCRVSVSLSGVPPCVTVDFYLRLCVVLVLCCLFGVVAVNMEASRKISGNSWASFLVTLAMNDSYQPRISIFEKKTWDYPTDLCYIWNVYWCIYSVSHFEWICSDI